MNKFKIGDRVRVSHAYRGDKEVGIKIGDTGVVLDDADVPWIRMDKYNENLGDARGLCKMGYGRLFHEKKLELIEEVKKEIFNIEKYQGKYAMNCETEKEAKEFCKYLNSVGRRWCNNKSYLRLNYHKVYEEETCYCFNNGEFSHKNFCRESGYEILYYKYFIFEIQNI